MAPSTWTSAVRFIGHLPGWTPADLPESTAGQSCKLVAEGGGQLNKWKLAGIAAALPLWLIAAAVLPHGLPAGIVLYGLILGGLTSLTAMGLVLVYRSARIINFAQAEIGGLAAAVAVVMVAGAHLPYALAVPAGLLAALATGALIDLT